MHTNEKTTLFHSQLMEIAKQILSEGLQSKTFDFSNGESGPIVIMINRNFYRNAVINPDKLGVSRVIAGESISELFQTFVYALGFQLATVVMSADTGKNYGGGIATTAPGVWGNSETVRLCRNIQNDLDSNIAEILVSHARSMGDFENAISADKSKM